MKPLLSGHIYEADADTYKVPEMVISIVANLY